MKPFSSFYDPKAMDPPLQQQIIDKYEANIYRDVEIAIKSVRSSKNMNTKVKNNGQTRKAMNIYLDFIEDQSCERIPIE
jgi:hypothetical protein